MMVAVLYMVLKLRWVIARIQSRLGPNRTGPWGVAQTVADALKLFQKEDIIPCGADRWLFTIAPALVFIPAYLVYVVIPFGEGLTAAQPQHRRDLHQRDLEHRRDRDSGRGMGVEQQMVAAGRVQRREPSSSPMKCRLYSRCACRC